MAINTKKCPRRKIEYGSLDELVADAERLVAADAPTTGNWSKGMIMEHVAHLMDMTLDGFGFTPPWILRFVGKWFLKRLLSGWGVTQVGRGCCESRSCRFLGGEPSAEHA